MWKIQLLLLNQASIFDGWIPQLKAKLTEIGGKKLRAGGKAGWAMVPPPPPQKTFFQELTLHHPNPFYHFIFKNLKENGSREKHFALPIFLDLPPVLKTV